MRVLYVIDSLGASGAEHSTADMMALLRERGHQVSATTLYDAGFGDEERLRSDGLTVTPLSASGFIGRVRELRALVREVQPDVVHTALFSADIIGRLAGWRTQARVVSSMVSTPYSSARRSDPNTNRWKLVAVRLIDSFTGHVMVDRFHAVSDGVAAANAHDMRLPANRISVVCRARSRSRLGEWSQQRRDVVRAALGLTDSDRVVIAVGRQDHVKAHANLVRAAEGLLQCVPDLKVMIAGRDGNATTVLREALAAHPAAGGVVTLLGHRHDVPDLLCAADVLVIPSIYEGTAGVALEAMALRCPVVCTDVAGVRGVLEHDSNSILVPVGDTPAIVAALAEVLTDSALAERLRRTGLEDFERRFATNVIAVAMEAFYEDVVSNGRHARN